MDRRVQSYLERAAEALRAGDADDAFAFERQAADEVERLGAPPEEEAALFEQRAARLIALRELARGRGLLEQVLEIRRARDDLVGEFAALHQLGLVDQAEGKHEQALAHLDAALRAAVRIAPSFPAAERAQAARAVSLRALGRDQEARAAVAKHEAPATPAPAAANPEDVEAILAELDALVGLAEVKQRIRSLASFMRVRALRDDAGLDNVAISHHLAFTGSPGTGKTTVARLFGRLLRALGVLATDTLIESSRAQLVAGFVGQTAGRVDAVVDSAIDGVLFIDEAYALTESDSSEDFGREAVTQLVKRMEDDRARLAVIVAGYPAPMERFLASNPGLESRIGEVIAFADYTPDELATIFTRFAEQGDYALSEAAAAQLREILAAMCESRDEHFGNARAARNLFEDAIVAQADRLVREGATGREQLRLLEPQDLDAARESLR